MNTPSEEKLAHVRKRIVALRKWLEETTPGVTSIAREGFAAGYNRQQAIDELKELEREESRLSGNGNPLGAIGVFRIAGNSVR